MLVEVKCTWGRKYGVNNHFFATICRPLVVQTLLVIDKEATVETMSLAYTVVSSAGPTVKESQYHVEGYGMCYTDTEML